MQLAASCGHVFTSSFALTATPWDLLLHLECAHACKRHSVQVIHACYMSHEKKACLAQRQCEGVSVEVVECQHLLHVTAGSGLE